MATRFYGSGVLQADRGQTRAALPRSKWDRIGGPGLTPSQNRTLVLVSVGFSTARHAGMRPSQPVQEAACGLVWRRSIKRHQRRWNSRDPDDVGSPAVGVDGHDLDLVHATTDGLFKAMNSRRHSYGPTRVGCRERRELSRSCYSETSEAPYETPSTGAALVDRALKRRLNNLFIHAGSTGYARFVHRFSTA